MPYNGSGSFAVVNTFTPGTTISSSQTNSNNADFAAGLSAVLVLDGQGAGMTGQFKAADGLVGAPGIAFALDLDTGFWRSGANNFMAVANGNDVCAFNDTGVVIQTGHTLTLDADPAANLQAATKQYVDTTLGAPSSTAMLFRNTSAPLGWTKDTTHNNKALRLVDGTVSTGGSVPFSTVFGKTSTDGHALSIGQMPQHSHSIPRTTDDAAAGAGQTVVESLTGAGTNNTNTAGSGQSHSHGMDIRVQYVDVIAAIKD